MTIIALLTLWGKTRELFPTLSWVLTPYRLTLGCATGRSAAQGATREAGSSPEGASSNWNVLMQWRDKLLSS